MKEGTLSEEQQRIEEKRGEELCEKKKYEGREGNVRKEMLYWVFSGKRM